MANQALCRCKGDHSASKDARSDHELHDANRRMHNFLALLGHELRNPLDAICNGLRILEQQGHDPSQREWARAMMERQTQAICRLVDGMLDVSRIEHGKIQLRKQPVDLTRAVLRAVETVRASVERLGHQLEVSHPPLPVFLNADSGRLEQVLTNIINNAAKFMEPNGRIWVTLEANERVVLLKVRDSGIGIDPETLPHIFNPFWQVDHTQNRSHGGLGIGLALVRSLVEMHGGRVSAHSAGLGHGSEFVVRLPTDSGMLDDVG